MNEPVIYIDIDWTAYMPVPSNGGQTATTGGGFPPYPTACPYPGGNSAIPPYPPVGASSMNLGGYSGMITPYQGQNYPGSFPSPYNPGSMPVRVVIF